MRTTIGALLILAAMGLCIAGGCEPKKTGGGNKSTTADAHEHHHGPNGGEIIELGDEEYHAELLQDLDEKIVKIFVLDKDQKPFPIAEEAVTIRMTINSTPTEFKVPAKPATGEEAGKSSRFESQDENLRMALGNETAEREIEVKIGEKPYKQKFDYYVPHSHGHAHDDEEHHDGAHADDTKAPAAAK